MKYIALVLLLSFPSIVFAEICPKSLVTKGTPSPCSGYILSPEVAEEATKLPKQISLLQDQLKLKDNDIDLRDKKIEILNQDRDKKDVMINTLHGALLEKNKLDDLKLGLTVGGSVIGTALVCLAIFAIASKVNVSIK